MASLEPLPPVLSQDVHPLRDEAGPPHDFGQFYMLVDPTGAPDFAARFTRLAQAVAADPGARLPGQGRTDPASVAVDAAQWQTVLELSGGA